AAQRPPVAASANALAAPAAVLTLRPAAPEMPTAAAPIAKRAWRFPVQSRSPVAVALAELDAGLSVAIRATALDQAERARLRDSVAALLSRHGWPLARLSLLTPQRGERE
ncbi:MAG: hypothetical protein K2X76_01695, partial [Sphingomonas sp.]|nr:hypothetical protein [Sphingomonas sp.]